MNFNKYTANKVHPLEGKYFVHYEKPKAELICKIEAWLGWGNEYHGNEAMVLLREDGESHIVPVSSIRPGRMFETLDQANATVSPSARLQESEI